jgi:hypothetical protein
MALAKIWLEVVDWIHLAQERPVATFCEYGIELQGFIEGGKFVD